VTIEHDKDEAMSAVRRSEETMTPVDEAIEYHDGDMRATIATLIKDCRFLREQLAVARSCMSTGLTRGWKPELER
jgi:hypothetical protein